MLRIGFLSQCVAPDALEATVQHLVALFAANEPAAMAAMKLSLAELARNGSAVEPIEARYLASLSSPALADRLKTLLG